MNLISHLENQSIDDLVLLAAKYPFAAVIYMVLAKKSKQIHHPKADEFLRKAAIRVPSRKILKEYLKVEKILETQLATIEDSNNSFTDDYDKYDQVNSRTENVPETEEKGDQIVIINERHKVDHKLEELSGDQLIVDQKSKDQKHDEKEFTGFDDDHVLKIGKQLVQEHQEQNIDQDHLKGTNKSNFDHSTELSSSVDSQQYELHSLEHDHVHEIGEELVSGNQIIQKQLNESFDDITVDDLRNKEDSKHESVYKKVVQILKMDYKSKAQNVDLEPNHILEDVHKNLENKNEYSELDDEEYLDEQENQQEDKKLQDEYDQELENLFAQAAYQANIEKQIEHKIEDDQLKKSTFKVIEDDKKEAELLNEEKSGSTDFLGWLQRFSRRKPKKTTKQVNFSAIDNKNEQLNLNNSSDIEIKPQEAEVNKTYREISTREVQEMARKSMSTDQSIYTETLAYVYELQDKKEKAIEVYKVLSAKYPQKSAYFADKIEKLK